MTNPELHDGLPSFLIIGAGKSGSRSLTQYLGAHPDIEMPNGVEEPHFFCREWHRGIDWYRSIFPGAEHVGARFEASMGYTSAQKYPGVPERIARVLPNVKLIYLVRHPLERIRSHYAYFVMLGMEVRPIREAVRTDPWYLELSRYGWQLDQHLEYFPRDRFLIITSDELRAEREATLRQVCEFVGVDAEQTIPNLDQEFNQSSTTRHPGPLSARLRHMASRTPLTRLKYKTKRRLIEKTFRERPVPAAIPRAFQRELWDELLPDLRHFKAIAGLDPDLWEPT